MKPVAVKINKGTPQERIIGILDTDKKVFSKTIRGSIHIFRVLDAIGVDSDYLTNVLLPNNYTIKVKDRETGRVYVTTAEVIKKSGEYYHFKNEHEDDRTQIFLPRRFWGKEEPLSEKEAYLISQGITP